MARFTFTARDVWADLMRDCAAARDTIEIEQYILMDDDIGVRFLSLLRDRAAAGVRVRLLLDRVGSRSIKGHPLLEELRQHGAHVAMYNHLHWGNLFMPHRWFPRNHAKTAMIDGHIFHIGSACMADYMAEWQEVHLRIEGEVIHNIEQDFAYRPEKDDNGYRYLRSHPGHRNPIYREMLLRINGAHKRICIATPYFLPPVLVKRALARAARRGVQVQMLVAAQPDIPIAGIVGQTYFERMRRKGVSFYLYEPAILHAKFMIVDDNWAMVGSTNLDYISLLRNREANLVIEDNAVVGELVAHFNGALRHCRIVDAAFWRNVAWPAKVLGYLGRAAKKVL